MTPRADLLLMNQTEVVEIMSERKGVSLRFVDMGREEKLYWKHMTIVSVLDAIFDTLRHEARQVAAHL